MNHVGCGVIDNIFSSTPQHIILSAFHIDLDEQFFPIKSITKNVVHGVDRDDLFEVLGIPRPPLDQRSAGTGSAV